MTTYKDLSHYRTTIDRICRQWPAFQRKRDARLAQEKRHGAVAEAVAERILEDLFTEVLDWGIRDLNNQVGYADISLSKLGIKRLVIEVKRPGALAWNQRAVGQAMDQARRYAAEQKIKQIAVSDGVILYAADVDGGVLKYRVLERLDCAKAPESLWWLSRNGLDRYPEITAGEALAALPRPQEDGGRITPDAGTGLLHPVYKIPARCFAYVGDANETATWKLPHRLIDGLPDASRIAGAVGAIVKNFRGVNVSIPDECIPDVLESLAKTAIELGKMPFQGGKAETYRRLEDALDQLGRLDELKRLS